MIGLASYLVFFFSIVLILGIVALGLVPHSRFTRLSISRVVVFYAIGAYTHAIVTSPAKAGMIANLGLPWAFGIAGAMVTTAFAAWLVGLVTIRLRGDYLAISTYGIAVSIQLVTLNLESLTGGPNGFPGIPRPLFTTLGSPALFNIFFLGVLVVVTGLVYWGLERILRSPWGRVLKAIREDETAAVALGKSALRFRLEAFVIGSTLMGLAGALYASYIGFVSPYDFVPILTFQIWAMVIVGGSGNNLGVLLGTLLVWAIWAASGVAVTKLVPAAYAAQGGALQVILIGLVLVLALLFRPRGLLGEAATVSRHAADD